MFLRLFASLLLMASTGPALTIGNAPVADGALDGYSAILVVNETDTFTNTIGGAATVTVDSWSVNIGAVRGRVTPFIVRVEADNTFTVLAIGTTRVAGADYLSAGVQTFPFAAGPQTFTLNAGEKIAAAYSDANPDGSGNAGSVVTYFEGFDEIWLTGGFAWNHSRYVTDGNEAGVRAMVAAMNDTVDEVVRVCDAQGIDADIRRTDELMVAINAAQMARMQAEVAHRTHWGEGARVRAIGAEVQDRVRIPGALGAMVVSGVARIQPAKLVQGLARICEGAGVQIVEGTAALTIAGILANRVGGSPQCRPHQPKSQPIAPTAGTTSISTTRSVAIRPWRWWCARS